MGNIKIGGKEYTEEEALELVQKGEDYTAKTMKLAEDKKAVDAKREYLKTLEGIDQYAQTHPEFNRKLTALIQEESAKARGVPFVNAGDESQSPNLDQGFDPGKAVANDDESEYVSKAELKTILSTVTQEQEQKFATREAQKEMESRVKKEFEDLRSRGYTKEELVKIITVAKQNSRFPIETAESMALKNEVPNRFTKKEEGDAGGETGEKVKLLKGKSGSGFALDKEEEEYIKSGGDPGELLKQKVAKKPGLLIIKEE